MPELVLRKYRMSSYRSGDGTYGVSRSSDHTIAPDFDRSPCAPARRIAFRLLPRNPLITNTIPSPNTGDGIGFIFTPGLSQTIFPVSKSWLRTLFIAGAM